MCSQRELSAVEADEQLARVAEELREALIELVRICQFRDRSAVCCYDVSVTQCHAIDVLAQSGPLTLNELAAALYLDKTTASRVVATLVRKKYVSRRASPEDGRSVILKATPAGKRLHARIRRDLNAEAAALLAGTGAEVRASTLQLLRSLAQSIAFRCGVECGTTGTSTPCAPAQRSAGASGKKACSPPPSESVARRQRIVP